MNRNNIFAILVLLFLFSCSNPSSPESTPIWLSIMIAEFESESAENPPQAIWRYTFRNETVYYMLSQCCDQFNLLFNEDGNLICFPDGGFTGAGDGKCPTFNAEKKDKKLIWEG